jgi:hypothetical protein
MTKRPIDRVREAAAQMEIGDRDDPSHGFLKMGDRLHVLKKRSIYQISLADEIDPERTNIHVPNTQQKVLHYGAATPFVGRTLLTARELFNSSHLTKEIDTDKCLTLIFDATKELALMADSIAALESELEAAKKTLQDNRRKDRSVALPAINNLRPRVKDFIESADDAISSLFLTVKHFFKDFRKGNWEEFAELIERKYGADDNFAKFLSDNMLVFSFVRRARNASVHPANHQKVTVLDFTFNPDNSIQAPTIEVVVPEVPQPTMDLLSFMMQLFESIVSVIEVVLAHLCEKHVQNFGKFEVHVVERSGQRKDLEHVRFGYEIFIPSEE